MPFTPTDVPRSGSHPGADGLPAPVGVLSGPQRDIAYARVVLEFWRQAYVVGEAERARHEEGRPEDPFLAAACHASPVVKMGIRLGPAELQAILRGEVPPDYEGERVAARILDVWLLSYDGRTERETWITYARDLTLLAHAEAQLMLGELPTLVTATLERVIQRLADVDVGRSSVS